MLYMLIGIYLSNLATGASYLELIPTSGFSCVYSSEASDPCTLGPTFPFMKAADQFSSSCEASFWKLRSIEVNHTYWCKVRIEVGVKSDLSECFLGNFPLSPRSHSGRELSRVGVHEAEWRKAPHRQQWKGYFLLDIPWARSDRFLLPRLDAIGVG